MLCKCHWIVLYRAYCAFYSILFGGGAFSGHGVYTAAAAAVAEYLSK